MSTQERDIEEFVKTFTTVDWLKDKTVMVTGATGLIGSCTVKCLLGLNKAYHLNMRIVVVVRNLDKAKVMFGDGCPSLSYYIYDFGSSADFLAPACDYIFHYACPTASRYFIEHPVETVKSMVNGTEMMLEYQRKHPTSCMVYVSSMEVYGVVDDDSKPLDEEMLGSVSLTDIRSSYPQGKRMAELMCFAYAKQYHLHVRIGRLAQTFGAGIASNDNRVFAQFARSIINKEDIILHTKGESARDYCYTTDAILGLFFILMHGEDGECYNIANEETYCSIREMADMLCREFNPNSHTIIQLQDGMGYPATTKLRLSTSKLRRLGWQPYVGLREMFARLIASLREEGE